MSDADLVLETIDGGIATLTLNNPDNLNALRHPMLDILREKVDRLSADDDVRVVVLTGAGRGFCAGGDVKGMAAGNRAHLTQDQRARSLRRNMELSRWLHEMPKPTIAMIRGPVAGAGVSLALACDLRVSSDTLRFTTAFAKVGLSGDYGGSWFLTRLVGVAKAKELYFTAAKIGAEEALALGIVNRVVPDDRLEAETNALARELAATAPIALSYMKQTMNAAVGGSLSEVFDLEAQRFARCAMTEDHKEAAKAFVEKRAPVFHGR